MKALCLILIVLTSLLLLTYPLVLMADIMAVAAVQPENPPVARTFFFSLFIWSSLLYPAAYLAGLIASLWTFRKNVRTATLWQAGVLGYVMLVIAAFIGWATVG